MRTELGATPTGRAGVAVQSTDVAQFAQTRETLGRLLDLAGRDLGSKSTVSTDEFGYLWVVAQDEQFSDVVALAQITASTLAEEGWRDALLCAVFGFEMSDAKPLHLVYACKRGSFYAFAPRAGHTRDLALELRAHALLEHDLPLERELEYRYPLWGVPV